MATVAILVDNYFEQAEFTEPKDALEAAGHDVVVVSTSEDSVIGLHHLDYGDEFEVDATIDDVSFEEYDALVLPGGVVNGDKLRMNQRARDWANYCVDNERPLAAICHAPWLLVSAGLAQDHELTSYFTLQDDIANAGGTWVDQEVVIDGVIITSRNPDDIPAFTQALLERLA